MFQNYRPNTRFTDLFRRAEENPILTASDWPYQVNSVFNPGATRLADGQTLLLARVEDRTGISHLTAARSQDGMTAWRIDPQPTFAPDSKMLFCPSLLDHEGSESMFLKNTQRLMIGSVSTCGLRAWERTPCQTFARLHKTHIAHMAINKSLGCNPLSFMLIMRHVPERAVRQWRSLIQFWQRLVGRRTKIKNHLRDLLSREGLSLTRGHGAWTIKGLAELEALVRPLGAVMPRSMKYRPPEAVDPQHVEIR
ncbi:MAG TPA: hypothetical protein VES69_00955 [Pyrinomonadaceae bacterium]|nr:hypothetical protein [Pyrinomonadaceae bacterium]